MADDTEPTPDPEWVNEAHKEIRQELQHMDAKDLMLEAAVNSRIAVRTLYRLQEPRLARLRQDVDFLYRVSTLLAVALPLLLGAVALWLKVA